MEMITLEAREETWGDFAVVTGEGLGEPGIKH